MAPKALPPAKISSIKLLGRSSLATTAKKISAKSISDDSRSLELGIVKKQVIQIKDLIKTNTLLKVKEEERKRKLGEQKKFGEREEKLEKPKEDKGNKIPSLPALPRLGFLERIKSFLFNMFLGYISLRLLPHLPKLAGIVDTIIKVQDVVIDISGKILNGLVSFVDKAYEVHDKTRKFLSDLGGDSFTKTFDGFIGAMDKVILASIAAAIAFGDLGGDGGGKKSSGPLKSGKELYKDYDRKRALIRKNYGDAAARIYDNEITNGKTPQQALNNLKRKYISTGKITPQRTLGLGEIKGSRLFDKGIDRVSGRLTTRILGRSGKKLILNTVKPFLKRLPIIGALLDFGLSVALGEDPGRAAFKAIGAGLLGSVGAAVGSLAFGFGGIIGGILGSIGGDALGGALYDVLFGNKKPPQQKSQGRAQGGPITRGGRLPGGPSRTIQKPKPRRTLKVQTTEVKPGQSVGGKKNIEKVFPEVETKDKGKTVNPLGYMKSSYKIGSSVPGFGGLDAIFMKARLGEKPSSTDYQRAADGLSAWVQRVYGGGIQRTGGAFAEGGKVDVSMFNDDIGMRNMLAKALQDTVSPKVDEMINDLRKQLGLKPRELEKEKTPTSGQMGVEGPEDFSGSTGAEKTMHYLISQGLTGAQAAGIAGNLQQESGFNPGADNSSHHGIAQWDKQIRWPRVSAYIRSVGRDPNTLEGQLVGLKWEAEQRGDWREIKKASSAREASLIWLERFERSGEKPGMPGFENRMTYANNLLAKYGNYVPQSTFSGTGGNIVPDARGTKLAGDLGDFMKAWGGVPGSVWQHSRHGGQGRRSGTSFHNVDRAIDLGANANEQGPILKKIEEFNRIKGVRPVQILHAGNDPSGKHNDHVHVAYKRGGKVKGKLGIDQIRAMLTHGEFVLDVDSTTALEKNFPGFLDALNKANYEGAIKVLRSYAEYEIGATIQAVVDEKLIPVPIPITSSQQSPVIISSGLGEVDDSMSFNYIR